MRAAHRVVFVASLVLTGALGPGCGPIHQAEVVVDPKDPVENCRTSFSRCAPPARFREDTDTATLDVHTLVYVASRHDVGRLASSAAARLRKLATEADMSVLVEIEAAMDDAENLLGKCRCEGVRTELEKKGIGAIIGARLPPRQLRKPETWAERITSQLATMRDLARHSAELAVEGATDAVKDTHARSQEVERELCETVHAARNILSQESFESMLELAVRKRATDAGEGSAEVARRTLREHARSSSCEMRR